MRTDPALLGGLGGQARLRLGLSETKSPGAASPRTRDGSSSSHSIPSIPSDPTPSSPSPSSAPSLSSSSSDANPRFRFPTPLPPALPCALPLPFPGLVGSAEGPSERNGATERNVRRRSVWLERMLRS
jgi:hypothetical protein